MNAKQKYNQIYRWLHVKLERAELGGDDDQADAFRDVIATMWALDQGLWDPDTHALDTPPPGSWMEIGAWGENKDIKWSLLCPICGSNMLSTEKPGEFMCPNEDCLLAFYDAPASFLEEDQDEE